MIRSGREERRAKAEALFERVQFDRYVTKSRADSASFGSARAPWR